MRVSIITKYFLPVIGGVENHCYNLAKSLTKRGFQVEVHTCKKTPEKVYNKTLHTFEVIDGIKVYRHTLFWELDDATKFDVIHFHNFNIFPHLLLFMRLLLLQKSKYKMPQIIITPHGGFTPPWEEFPPIIRHIKKMYHMTFGRFFINKIVDYVIAVSEWEKKQLKNAGIDPRKVVIIPNGVENLAYKYPSLKQNKEFREYKPYILFIGRIAKIKNIEQIILNLKYTQDIKLLITGPVHDNEYIQLLRQLISKLGLDNRVIFLGKSEGLKKYKLIDNAVAIVLLSKSEAEPIVIKEAIARGKIAIVSSIPVFYLDFNSIPGVFIIENADEFVRVINEIANSEKTQKKIEVIHKRISKRWKWEQIITLILELYLNGGDNNANGNCWDTKSP